MYVCMYASLLVVALLLFLPTATFPIGHVHARKMATVSVMDNTRQETIFSSPVFNYLE